MSVLALGTCYISSCVVSCVYLLRMSCVRVSCVHTSCVRASCVPCVLRAALSVRVICMDVYCNILSECMSMVLIVIVKQMAFDVIMKYVMFMVGISYCYILHVLLCLMIVNDVV